MCTIVCVCVCVCVCARGLGVSSPLTLWGIECVRVSDAGSSSSQEPIPVLLTGRAYQDWRSATRFMINVFPGSQFFSERKKASFRRQEDAVKPCHVCFLCVALSECECFV